MTAFIIVVCVGVAIAVLVYCVFILLGSMETKQKRAAQQALLSETGGDAFVELYKKAQTDEEREEIVIFALKSGNYKNAQQAKTAVAAENIIEEGKPLTEPEEDYLEEDMEENTEDLAEENDEYIEEVVVYTNEYVEEELDLSTEEEDMEQTIFGVRKQFSPKVKEQELKIFDLNSPKESRDPEE